MDISHLPEKIRAVVEELSKKIEFEAINPKGGNGYVLIGTNRIIERKVVVKFYYWGDGAHAEPRLLSELASPHVLKIYDAASIDDQDAYFVAPFCDNGDLDDLMKNTSIGVIRAVDFILDVASGASFIHSKGYIHRDLKPSNIFCDSNSNLLVGDFGSVVKKGAQGFAETGSKHSLLYRTPEEISTNRAYETSDVYQIGVILYQLLGGCLPYDEQSWLNAKDLAVYKSKPPPENQFFATKIIEEKITKGRLIDLSSLPDWCPQQLVKIVRKCCKPDKDARFSNVAELIARLNNVRKILPDWQLEPEPVLYRKNAKFRIVDNAGTLSIEKMVIGAFAWRKKRKLKPKSIGEAVKMAEEL